jgi:hypothetical protein
MKKIEILILLASLLSACTLTVPDLEEIFFPGGVQATPATSGHPTQTNPLIPSITPVLATPTFTATPTKVGELTATVTSFFTEQVRTPIPVASPTPTSIGEGFDSVEISGNAIYWGVCKPGEVTVTAFVTKPNRVGSVVIFVHLVDTTSKNSTPWSTGDVMDKWGNGRYTYVINADVIDEHRHYSKAWVVYQLVATGAEAKIVGRTPVFTNNLTLAPCA